MIGYARTPDWLADLMVEKVFDDAPEASERILFPGVGRGPFVRAVDRYCEEHSAPVPEGVGIDLDEDNVAHCRERYDDLPVEFVSDDYLKREQMGRFDYVIGNPPYVSLEHIPDDLRSEYRDEFKTATGRFDLYFLFFERAIGQLADSGRLSFVTPEKFEYVNSAARLRSLLSDRVIEIHHVDEDAFEGLTTYPSITTVAESGAEKTRVIRRDGSQHETNLPSNGDSWASEIRGGVSPPVDSRVTLEDVCRRISCGAATGADDVFIRAPDEVPAEVVDEIGYPSISGESLGTGESEEVILIPYDSSGSLLTSDEIPASIEYFSEHRGALEERWCVREDDTAWYGWHQRPAMESLFKPKIMCQDVTDEPSFHTDLEGAVVPQHSVYYLIPSTVDIDELVTYLNSLPVSQWLHGHCPHASNGFLRVQSSVMKDIPVPERFATTYQSKLGENV